MDGSRHPPRTGPDPQIAAGTRRTAGTAPPREVSSERLSVFEDFLGKLDLDKLDDKDKSKDKPEDEPPPPTPTTKTHNDRYYSTPEESTAPAAPGIPHNREAEEAVVGAVLINPEVYYDVAQFLRRTIFTSTATAGSGRPSPACTSSAFPSTS